MWARVIVNGADQGGGVVLTSRFLLTAGHCVRGVAAGSPDADVKVVLGDAQVVNAVLQERAEASDLALLKLSHPVGSALPLASRCRRGDEWYAPARPFKSDPELVGQVAATMPFECVAGGVIEAVQLTTQSDLGQYVGYSGGPVFLSPEEHNKIIGILIEQYPDRIDAARASNTLFAAAILDAIDQFASLTNSYLLRTLIGEQAQRPPISERAPAARAAGAEAAVLAMLDRQGVLDPEIRAVYQVLVSKWALAPSAEQQAASGGEPM